MKRTLVLGLLLAVLASSCQWKTNRDELAEARSNWQRAAITDYQISYRWSCECPEEWLYEYTVEVVDGKIVDVRTAEAQPVPDFIDRYTVEALFEKIEAGIDQFEEDTEFRYDEETGVPKVVSLAVSAQAVDGGEHLTITEFTPTGG